MNKIKKIAVYLIIFVFCVVLSGCSNTNVLTGENFKEKLESMGYNVRDVTDAFETGTVEEAYLAVKKDIVIQFRILEDEEKAIDVYEQMKKDLEEKGNNSSNNSNNNKDKFVMNIENRYIVLTRVGNTILYSDVGNHNKKEVENNLNELGY